MNVYIVVVKFCEESWVVEVFADFASAADYCEDFNDNPVNIERRIAHVEEWDVK
jgi:hypothetical protein